MAQCGQLSLHVRPAPHVPKFDCTVVSEIGNDLRKKELSTSLAAIRWSLSENRCSACEMMVLLASFITFAVLVSVLPASCPNLSTCCLIF